MVTTLRATTCPRCAGTQRDPPAGVNVCLLCDGRGHVEDVRLSPNFWYHELIKAHEGFDQSPSVDAMDRLRALCLGLLEPVRAKVGPLKVTSGYRCPAYDAHVAGPPFDRLLSGHSVGAAADVQPLAAGVTLRDVMEAAADLDLDQRILEGGCVHLAIYAPYPLGEYVQRRQAFVRLPHPDGAPRFLYARWDPSDPSQVERAV